MSYKKAGVGRERIARISGLYRDREAMLNSVQVLRKRGFSNLKILRRSKGLTLEELSLSTGISPSYLSRLEGGGRRLNSDLLTKLSSVLECQPADLLGNTLVSLNTAGAKSEASKTRMQRSFQESEEESLPCDLPVYRLEFGGKEQQKGREHTVNFDAVADWSHRPYDLKQIPKAFGLSISGDSCAPFYCVGDIVFVHPMRPISPGCRVFCALKSGYVFLAVFHGREDGNVFLSLPGTPENEKNRFSESDFSVLQRVVGVRFG